MSTEADRPADKSQLAAASQNLLFGSISLGKAAGELLFFVCTVAVPIFVAMLGLGYWILAMADAVPVLPGGEKFASLPFLTRLNLYTTLGFSASLTIVVSVIECLVQVSGTTIANFVQSIIQFRDMVADSVMPRVEHVMLEEIMRAICEHGNASKIAAATADAVPAPV